jgi:hypothetical protein
MLYRGCSTQNVLRGMFYRGFSAGDALQRMFYRGCSIQNDMKHLEKRDQLLMIDSQGSMAMH